MSCSNICTCIKYCKMSGADPGFLERGFRFVKEEEWGGGGGGGLAETETSFANFISFFLNIP